MPAPPPQQQPAAAAAATAATSKKSPISKDVDERRKSSQSSQPPVQRDNDNSNSERGGCDTKKNAGSDARHHNVTTEQQKRSDSPRRNRPEKTPGSVAVRTPAESLQAKGKQQECQLSSRSRDPAQDPEQNSGSMKQKQQQKHQKQPDEPADCSSIKRNDNDGSSCSKRGSPNSGRLQGKDDVEEKKIGLAVGDQTSPVTPATPHISIRSVADRCELSSEIAVVKQQRRFNKSMVGGSRLPYHLQFDAFIMTAAYRRASGRVLCVYLQSERYRHLSVMSTLLLLSVCLTLSGAFLLFFSNDLISVLCPSIVLFMVGTSLTVVTVLPGAGQWIVQHYRSTRSRLQICWRNNRSFGGCILGGVSSSSEVSQRNTAGDLPAKRKTLASDLKRP